MGDEREVLIPGQGGNDVPQYSAALEALEFTRVTLSFKGLSYAVSVKEKGKRISKPILRDCLGVLRPGQLTAIMGASGSGKTTLLDALAGRITNGLTGEIFINGRPRDESFRKMSGYVIQDDAVMGTLTVEENLLFSAQLRLPRSIPLSEKKKIVQKILSNLGLEKVTNSKVGTELIRGVSGGEKKRVNVGMELVTSPGILFLDEPTTGLDSTTANDVVLVLKRLAQVGHTIVMSVHQPRFSIFKLFDHLILASEGELAYSGPPLAALEHFRTLGFTCEPYNNPADFFLDVLNDYVRQKRRLAADDIFVSVENDEDSFAKKFSQTEAFKNLLEEVDAIHGRKRSNSILWLQATPYSTPFSYQFFILSKRVLLDYIRNPLLSVIQFITCIFFGLLVGIIYWNVGDNQSSIQNRSGALFFIIITLVFNNLSAVEIFIKERRIFANERSNGYYSTSAYFLAKALCDLIPLRIIPTMFLAILAYFLTGFQTNADKVFIYLVIMIVTTDCGAALCFAVSSFVPVAGIANAIISIFLTFFMLFGGLFINVKDIPVYFRWLEYISIFKYSLEAATINEFTGLQFVCDADEAGPGGECPISTGEQYLERQGFKEDNLWLDVIALSAMTLIYLMIAYVGLRCVKAR